MTSRTKKSFVCSLSIMFLFDHGPRRRRTTSDTDHFGQSSLSLWRKVQALHCLDVGSCPMLDANCVVSEAPPRVFIYLISFVFHLSCYSSSNKQTTHHFFILLCRNYHVTVTANELSFGYSCGCASCTVDRSHILTVEVIPLIKPFLDWGGYGIRKQLPSWETGYIGKKGPGVRITIKDENGKERAYTFTCDDPEQVVTLLTT